MGENSRPAWPKYPRDYFVSYLDLLQLGQFLRLVECESTARNSKKKGRI